MKYLNVKVGIYEASAELIKHKNGGVTIVNPTVFWTNNTGILKRERIYLKVGDKVTKMAINVFNGKEKSYYNKDEIMNYAEFYGDYLSGYNN